MLLEKHQKFNGDKMIEVSVAQRFPISSVLLGKVWTFLLCQ